MAYIIAFEPKAIQDIAELKKSGNKAVTTKIERLLLELREHPTTGTGQVEALKGNLSGFWSRRIDKFISLDLHHRRRKNNRYSCFSKKSLWR